MTALDDALAQSSIVFGPHPVKATWREYSNGDYLTNTDSISDLALDSDGSMTISHSLDDGLPDPVTMSTKDSASGQFKLGLVGRQGLKLGQSGFRTFVNTNSLTGSWNSDPTTKNLVVPLPSTTVQGDSLIAAVLVDSASANIYQTVADPKDQWTLLGSQTDGIYQLFVYYKRRQNITNPLLVLASDVSVNFLAHVLSFWGLSPSNGLVDYKAVQPTFLPEAGTVAAHSITATQPVTGYTVTFWGQASASGNMTTTGVTKFAGPAANGVQITSGISAFREAGSYTSTGTNAGTDSSVPMASITLQAYERPKMDARKYFSPFNTDSPVYNFDQDTAGVVSSIRTLTATGPVDTQMFSGQMQGVGINGHAGELQAISKTRIRMNRSIELPVVSGYREGLTLDWLITWLASRGSQFVGPSPNRYTRYWAPLHGSIHPHLSGPYPYSTGVFMNASGGPFGYKNMVSVTGPFLTGMYAEQTATRIQRIRLQSVGNFTGEPTDAFPHITEAGGPFRFDAMSQTCSRGRISFWVRGDAIVTPPSFSTEDLIAKAYIISSDASGSTNGFIICGIDQTRTPYIQMTTTTGGSALVTYAASGLLPTDGLWHFFGFWWDLAAGQARVNHNNTISSSNFWLTSGFNSTVDLPVFDGEGNSIVKLDALFHLPVAEFMYDAGFPDPVTSITPWADQYPIPVTSPGQSMTMRSTGQSLRALAGSQTVNCWDTLAELAQSSLSARRVNELDNLEFLPLSYFGETAQMTPVVVQDTRTNAGDLDITVDKSMIRNGVTVQFQDTRIDTNPTPVLKYNTSVEILPGTSIITFPLDRPCVELHGGNDFDNTNYKFINLTSGQIATPTTIPVQRHFVTMNTSADGSGTVLVEASVIASFSSADGQSVDIKFSNKTGASVFMANNGDQVPFLQIWGYGVTLADGYSSVSDANSKAIRGDRGLDAELDWIQDRSTAQDIAGKILNITARARPQLKLTVMGDPRRTPGQMITVNDSEGTGAAGNWRVLGVDHNVSGAQYTQDLSVVQALPAAVWDGADGWDEGVWS
jgi:hypothetical protein